MTEFPPYRPDGVWSAVLDMARQIEVNRYVYSDDNWALVAGALQCLAERFELLHGCREQDLARLLRAIAGIEIYFGDPDEDDAASEFTGPGRPSAPEDRSLNGE
jgi:hypothetical protein